MSTQRLNGRDRATLDRIVRPAQAMAELVRAATGEFLRSDHCRREIARVINEELERLAEEDERCL